MDEVLLPLVTFGKLDADLWVPELVAVLFAVVFDEVVLVVLVVVINFGRPVVLVALVVVAVVFVSALLATPIRNMAVRKMEITLL